MDPPFKKQPTNAGTRLWDVCQEQLRDEALARMRAREVGTVGHGPGMCMYVDIYIYMYIHTGMRACMRAHIHVFVCICLLIYQFIQIHMYV